MELATDFATFLNNIRLTDRQVEDLKTGHETLRKRLREDEDLSKLVIADFLQGSYRRSTAVRPKGQERADVDVIVVTNLSEDEYTPKEAMALFVPFLEKHYKGKYRQQGRSFGIKLSYVELDLVITSAPKEAEKDTYKSDAVESMHSIDEAKDWRLNASWVDLESRYSTVAALLEKAKSDSEWKLEPLRIPDRTTDKWDSTHPLEQIKWTVGKSSDCNGHFVNVVKALKWWRLENDKLTGHPKGFPLERIIGECCPNGIGSVAEGVTLSLENIVSKYKTHISLGIKPVLPDYGVPEHDVFARITVDEFKLFYEQAESASEIARKAFDSTDRTKSGNLWRELFGDKFPKPPSTNNEEKGGFEKAPAVVATPSAGFFA